MNNLTISNFDTFSENLFLEVNMTLAQFKKIIKSLPKNTELVAQVGGISCSIDDIIISVDQDQNYTIKLINSSNDKN